MLLIACFMVSMLISIMMVPGLIRMAAPLGLVDEPNERKVHTTSIPRVGGIAIALGALIPIGIWVELNDAVHAYLIASTIIVVFGIWDDRTELGYRTKFFGQILAVAVFIIYGGVTIEWLPFQGLDSAPLWLSIFLTFFALLGITNAVNLSDGLDGLAGGTSMLSLAGIALLALSADANFLALLCLAICGSVFGFLRYNTHPARIFMGDTGSQFLGFSVGVAAVLLTQKANTALSPVLPLIILGLPILDTLTVMTRRILAGRSPFSPDKNHFHHRLIDMNFKHHEAVIIIYLVQIVLIALAFVCRYQSDLLLLALFLAFCFGFNGMFHFYERNNWAYQGSWYRVLASPVNDLIERRKTAKTFINWVGIFLQLSLPVFLLFNFWDAREANGVQPVLIGMLVGAFAVFVIPQGEMSLWFRRALWYSACGLGVYCGVQTGFSETLVSKAYTVFLVVSVLIAFYVSQADEFRVNPLDVIVLVGAGLILYLSNAQSQGYPYLGIHFAQIMLLLYSVELALKQSKVPGLDKWPLLVVLLLAQIFSFF